MAVDKFSSAAGPNTGLIKIVPTSVAVGSGSGSVDVNGNVTFSGATTISLNGCFTANYDNYKIIINPTSGGSYTTFRLRQSGSDDSLASYEYAVFSIYSAPGSGVNQYSGNANQAEINQTNAPTEITLYNPYLATNTRWNFNSSANYSTGGAGAQLGGGYKKDTKQYDGFTYIHGNASTSFSGTIRVYGYNQ